MNIVIEKGVPLPISNTKYPFESMEVGDSFTVPNDYRKSLQATISYFHQRGGKRYTVRKNGDICRCWRVE